MFKKPHRLWKIEQKKQKIKSLIEHFCEILEHWFEKSHSQRIKSTTINLLIRR